MSSRPNSSDDIDVESLCLSPEEVAEYHASRQKPERRRRPKKERFCMIPLNVMAGISKAGCPVIGVLAALYDTWFQNGHYNPVQFTNDSLRKYAVSREQKRCALKILEKSGQIYVDREPRKNPSVTLNWLPLKDEFPR